MGTWGTGIFSDDLAADVRREWRSFVGEGLPGSEATRQILERYVGVLSDPNDRSVFWIALALTQHRAGRPDPLVQMEALAAIASGADLERWHSDVKQQRTRAVVLSKVRQELESPPPAAKRIPRTFRNTCDWLVGEVVAYTLLSGRRTLFRIVDHHSDEGGTTPEVEVLDWFANRLPEGAEWADVDGRAEEPEGRRVGAGEDPAARLLLIGAASPREFPTSRLQRLGIVSNLPGPTTSPRSTLAANWRHLDHLLLRFFGLS